MGNSVDRTVLCGILTQSQGQMAWILMFIPKIRKNIKRRDEETMGQRMPTIRNKYVAKCVETMVAADGCWVMRQCLSVYGEKQTSCKHDKNDVCKKTLEPKSQNVCRCRHDKARIWWVWHISKVKPSTESQFEWNKVLSILEIYSKTVTSATYYFELLHRLHQSTEWAYRITCIHRSIKCKDLIAHREPVRWLSPLKKL